jgi:hypothetical protein
MSIGAIGGLVGAKLFPLRQRERTEHRHCCSANCSVSYRVQCEIPLPLSKNLYMRPQSQPVTPGEKDSTETPKPLFSTATARSFRSPQLLNQSDKSVFVDPVTAGNLKVLVA